MQLFVKRSAHDTQVVDVDAGCSVADVLAALEAAPGERLLQSGRPLPAAARPAAAASLALAAPLRGGMTIKVKTLTGREIEVDIEPTDTVERIKERLEEKEGIAPDQQRLIYSGKQMNDDKPVKDYNIEGGCVLHLVIALRGGC